MRCQSTGGRALLAVALSLALLVAARPAAAGVLVFAAASLKNALDAAAADYQHRGGEKIVVSYAASSALARQIENGAPADIFISADPDWMNYLAVRHLIEPATRRNLLGNKLVLIEPVDSPLRVEIKPGFPLAALLKGGHLAMANPDAVPAGRYGKAALETLGVWASVAPKVVRAEDVRAALRFVSRREAPLGIVYQTDVTADPRVKIAAYFPADTYPPIIYPIAILAGDRNPGAAKFLAYLESPAAKPVFLQQGFTVLKP